MNKPETLTAAGVAGLLGITDRYFLSIRGQLEAHGFPPRLPGLGRWSRFAVTRWVRTNGETFRPAQPEISPEFPGAPAIGRLAIELERDYAQ